ncbi:MAG: YhcH/YjgK/YiaL family protein [Treponemataceae bacterium]
MIFANINDVQRYSYLEKKLLQCLAYAKDNNLQKMHEGKHQIDGDEIFVNISEYTTVTKEERFWESHRKYIDIHLMITGCEKIALNHRDNLTQKEYDEQKDYLALEGEDTSIVTLQEGDFLICYPEDAHITAIKVGKGIPIKKAIFKVRI